MVSEYYLRGAGGASALRSRGFCPRVRALLDGAAPRPEDRGLLDWVWAEDRDLDARRCGMVVALDSGGGLRQAAPNGYIRRAGRQGRSAGGPTAPSIALVENPGRLFRAVYERSVWDCHRLLSVGCGNARSSESTDHRLCGPGFAGSEARH